MSRPSGDRRKLIIDHARHMAKAAPGVLVVIDIGGPRRRRGVVLVGVSNTGRPAASWVETVSNTAPSHR